MISHEMPLHIRTAALRLPALETVQEIDLPVDGLDVAFEVPVLFSWE